MLAEKPWRNHAAIIESLPPTMLTKAEINLLHWLTSSYYRGQGAIVDAGCFLGGSTVALADGLKSQGPKSRAIHSYDIFLTTQSMWFDGLRTFGLEPNQSFEGQYRQNVARYSDLIQHHAGDLLDKLWTGPVEILFLDICKSPQLHDHSVELWFPQLIPGRSIVIQQDYGWVCFPWGNVMMEAYRDHFEILDDVPATSRVYLCTKEIRELRKYDSFSPDEKMRFMQAALASVVHLPKLVRNNLLINYAQLAHSLGRLDLVKPTLDRLTSVEPKDSGIPSPVREFLVSNFPADWVPAVPAPPVAAPAVKKKLPLHRIVHRELNRLVGRKAA